MKLKYILIALSAALVVWFIYDSFSQPGPQDLEGDFKEVAMYRNENNTGPIVRIYAVTVADTLWEAMQAYGDYMPHTKYGNTSVYFFLEGNPAPDEVFPGEPNFPQQYQEYNVAVYEKDAMSQVAFRKHPFRR
ncbi:hypothetical protein DXT99_26495 [Pontibacter diazotrophicus]|uniref:Uncharacterized protein n=1 Tax=Pontibacter diazotrophicus TaxID=1400979 RepID=A0A3D8KYV5_9BACT|nr:hypothetical protein [Pontibacter diazotrophicus]RDV10360.1 hypothetical protein DXT99_26495 [Pontibacter diazotrophicus]